jgi:hypothetical protein
LVGTEGSGREYVVRPIAVLALAESGISMGVGVKFPYPMEGL